jgi:hypothetical protein
MAATLSSNNGGVSSTAATNTVAVAYAGAVTSGNTLIAFIATEGVGASITISDSVNGSWTEITGAYVSHTGFGTASAFVFNNTGAGTPTVTATATGFNGVWRALQVFEVAGAADTGPINVANTAQGASSVPSVSFTTTNANALGLAFAHVAGTVSNLAPWSYVRDVDGNSVQTLADTGAAGSTTATWDSSQTTWSAIGLAISDVATGGGGGSTGEVAFVASGAAVTATSGNVTPSYPAGIQADDILVCQVTSYDNVSVSFGGTGWTKKSETNNGSNLRQTIAWKRRASGDSDTNVVITHTAGDRIIARVHALRNAKRNGDPFEAVATNTPAAASSGTFPNVTTTLPFDLLVYALSYGNDFSTGPSISNAQGLTLTERDETEVA